MRMEESVIQKEPVLPPPFGSVQNPVTMMMHEHDSAGEALRSMRKGSAGYTPPDDACISFQTLYKALAGFEADLHQHIHLENKHPLSPGNCNGKGAAIAAGMAGPRKARRMTELSEADWSRLGAARSTLAT